jgi:hypothetical protein
MMGPRKKVLDSPTARAARHVRRYVEADGVSGYPMKSVTPGLYTVAPEALPQQTDTITAKLDA